MSMKMTVQELAEIVGGRVGGDFGRKKKQKTNQKNDEQKKIAYVEIE